jgi:hypothetical protein
MTLFAPFTIGTLTAVHKVFNWIEKSLFNVMFNVPDHPFKTL